MDVRKLVIFITNIKEIDNAHLDIAVSLKNLYNLVSSGSDLDEQITVVRNCILKHFSIEDKSMALINYPYIEEHRQGHKLVLNTIDNITNYNEPIITILKESDVIAIYEVVLIHTEYHDNKFLEFTKIIY